ncbi:MAG: D-alanine--D-alanine ligase [bacterium]
MKVVILHGEILSSASPDEQDVLVEVKAVSSALEELGYEPVSVSVGSDINQAINHLQEEQPIVVFNLVESLNGQGRFIHLIPLHLDYLNIPYTGAKTDALYLTSNKILAKRTFSFFNIPTPDWITYKEVINKKDQINFSSPYLFKSIWEHASIGLDDNSLIADYNKLTERLKQLDLKNSEELFLEQYIEGREFNITLLSDVKGIEVMPAAEIRFNNYTSRPKILGYKAKWDKNSVEYQNTQRCFDFSKDDLQLIEQLRQISLRCWDCFELSGYARVDFRVDNLGRPWVLEINVNPCISPDSGFVAAAQRGGIGYKQLVERLILPRGKK